MEKGTRNELLSRILAALKAFFKKDLAFKIISLVFAMLIWGYVMMDQNPMRAKTIEGVTASFEGEADLISRKLIVRGNRTELLSGMSVNVSAQLTDYAAIGVEDVKATVSLRNVTDAGSYTLPVFATCTGCTAESVEPGSVEIEIDELVTKRIPIEYKVISDIEEGYWAAEPVLSRSEIDIQGPARDVSAIIKGICYVDVSGRTESYNEAMGITLLNAQGESVDSSVLYGQLASVSVKQTILPKKTVVVNAADSLLGADNIAANYQIAAVHVTPVTVEVAGRAEVLESLKEIGVENIDVAGRSESLLTIAELIVPEGVTLIKEDDLVSVYVDIRENTEMREYPDLSVRAVGAERGQEVRIAPAALDLEITGGVSLMQQLDRANVTLYVDVTDLEPGTYDITVQLGLPDDKMLSQVSYSTSADMVRVTIE